MKIGAIMIIGVFFNMMMLSVFPTLFLGENPNMLEGDTLGYDFKDNGIITQEYIDGVGQYEVITNTEQLESLTDTQGGIVSGITEAVGSFFDGLLDGLQKLSVYLSFVIPFSTVFFALPSSLGLIIGTLYSTVLGIAIIRFIRGV